MRLVLASSSPYRQALLARLGLPFESVAPDIDEGRLPDEEIDAYVARLSLEKARAVAREMPDALVIGSDQACVLDGDVLGKPGTRAAALAQLRRCAGRTLVFRTGLALCGPGFSQVLVEPFEVKFRPLGDTEIERYLDLDQPYDCAGSFKAEAAGVLLFEEMRGRDFNALVGLPLIALCGLLRDAGLNPLAPPGGR